MNENEIDPRIDLSQLDPTLGPAGRAAAVEMWTRLLKSYDRNHATIEKAAEISYEQRMRESRLSKAGILPAYRAADLTIGAAHTSKGDRVQTLRSWASQPDGWLYLYGPPGAGKTWLLSAVCRAVIFGGRSALYITAQDAAEMLRKRDGERDAFVGRLKVFEVLCLDDLGSVHNTDWLAEQFGAILDHRHNHNRPTAIASNVSIEEMIKSPYHLARTGERILERCRPDRAIKITGGSRR